jgi:hypothetical protein
MGWESWWSGLVGISIQNGRFGSVWPASHTCGSIATPSIAAGKEAASHSSAGNASSLARRSSLEEVGESQRTSMNWIRFGFWRRQFSSVWFLTQADWFGGFYWWAQLSLVRCDFSLDFEPIACDVSIDSETSLVILSILKIYRLSLRKYL